MSCIFYVKGRKIHEAACRRHSNAPADDTPEEILPDVSIPPLLADEPEEEPAEPDEEGETGSS